MTPTVTPTVTRSTAVSTNRTARRRRDGSSSDATSGGAGCEVEASPVTVLWSVRTLGWRDDIQLAPTGDKLSIDIRDKDGNAVRGLAIKATAGGAAQAEAMRRSQSIKDAKDRESAEEIAKVLVSRTINVKARSAAGGKLFGSVTNVEIAHAIAEQANVELDRKTIHLDEHIKTTGSHQVQIRLHGDVEFPVTVEVTGS